jgi:hypothetical protein
MTPAQHQVLKHLTSQPQPVIDIGRAVAEEEGMAERLSRDYVAGLLLSLVGLGWPICLSGEGLHTDDPTIRRAWILPGQYLRVREALERFERNHHITQEAQT